VQLTARTAASARSPTSDRGPSRDTTNHAASAGSEGREQLDPRDFSARPSHLFTVAGGRIGHGNYPLGPRRKRDRTEPRMTLGVSPVAVISPAQGNPVKSPASRLLRRGAYPRGQGAWEAWKPTSGSGPERNA